MKTTIKSLVIILLLSTMLSLDMHSQISTFGVNNLAKVKGGTTYVAMNDPSAERAKEYKDVFEKHWNISKVQFIKYSEIGKYIAPGNSFLTITMYTESLQMVTRLSDGGVYEGVKSQKKYFNLELWVVADNFFESKKNLSDFGVADKKVVAWVAIGSEFATTNNEERNFLPNYNLDEHLRNWGPGILKNYIQAFNSYFSKNEEHGPYMEMYNASELSKLKTETLYVPDFVLIKTALMSGDESEKHSEKDLFEDYKLKYKIVTSAELNKKILTETTPFYYFLFIRTSNHKYINVVNAATGEIVYGLHQVGAYNVKSKDFKELQKKIQSN